MIRSAKESEEFPYRLSTMCYFEVYEDGKVSKVYHKNKCDIAGLIEVCKRVEKNITTLYAVWPGKYSSDLFIIDDLDLFAESFGLFTINR